MGLHGVPTSFWVLALYCVCCYTCAVFVPCFVRFQSLFSGRVFEYGESRNALCVELLCRIVQSRLFSPVAWAGRVALEAGTVERASLREKGLVAEQVAGPFHALKLDETAGVREACPLGGRHRALVVKVDGAEDKSARLKVIRVRLPSGVTLSRGWHDGENGQVYIDEVAPAGPGGQVDNHGAEVTRAGLYTPVDLWGLGVKLDLKSRRVITRTVCLAETRAHAGQDAEHNNPSCLSGKETLCSDQQVLPALCCLAREGPRLRR